MKFLENVDEKNRLAAGLLFLIIAVAVLLTSPFVNYVTAAVASLNILISAVFLLTVGRDTTETDRDMGLWLLSLVTATGTYLGVSMFVRNEFVIFEFLVFIIAFGLVLGLLDDLRWRIVN